MKSFFFIGACFIFFFAGVSPQSKAVFATIPSIPCDEILPGCSPDTPEDFEETYLLSDFIPFLLSWLMRISASSAILMGVVSGVMFLFSGGNEELKTRAIKTFTYSGIGLLVAIFAYFIVEMINRLDVPGA